MRYRIAIFISIFNYFSWSQSFQLIKQVGDKNSDFSPVCETLKTGETILGWNYSEYTSIDGLKTKLLKNKSLFVVAMLDKFGKAKWIWYPDSCNSSMSIVSLLYSKNQGKIFLSGNFNNSSVINKQVYKGNHNCFVIRLDTNGNFEKIFTLADTSYLSLENFIINKSGDLIVGINYRNINGTSFKISSHNFSINKTGSFLIKLDKDLKLKNISEPIYGNKTGKLFLNLKKNYILSITTYVDSINVDSIRYNNPKGICASYLTTWDSFLKFKNIKLIITCSSITINSICILPNDYLVIAGQFRDSISLISKKFISSSNIPFLMCIDTMLSLNWAKIPEISIGESLSGQITALHNVGNYLYGGGIVVGKLKYNNFILPDSCGIFWYFKTDNSGNILWMNRTARTKSGQYITNISSNIIKNVFLAGFISDTININNLYYVTEKYKSDVILIKIHDIDILRGYVSPGPYCAGDTIKVPYTKNGDFNKDNQFIAQLSDEKGNFEGGERELGRITSDTDGVIKGILPMFDVQSSPHYRIRIISTSPVVQSYYKYDTLRLLIYSKDTANAGADTSICNGTSLKLKTSGGSLWHWSPGELTTDSILKTTTAFPDKTTKYRVIISDSSGCGKTDTAYKMVYLKPPLKIKGLPLDTHVCKNDQVYLKIKPNGGLGNNYSFEWLSQYNVSLGLSDTIRLKITSPMYVKAVLSDGCTVRNDTQTISIKYKNIAFSQLLADTLLCNNTETLLKLRPSDGETKNYFYYWYSPLNEILSNTDTLRYKPVQNTILKAIITNVCNEISDTSFVKITVPEAISSNIEKPSCFDSSLTLTVKATGGFKNILTHVWYRASKPIDIGKTLNLDGIKTKQKITVKSSDYCKTEKKDSIELIPEPKAIIKLSKDTICENDNLIIQNQSTSYTEIVSSINWENNKNKLQNKDTSITLKNTGLQYIKLNITDSIGCKASDSAKVQVIQNPEATFYITPQNPTVDNGSIELSPQNKEYTEYLWQIGNDLKIKHRYWSIVRLPVFDTSTYKATLIVKNKYACTDTVSQTIKIAESDAFYIPNAVSNNGDGLNDEFAPYGWKVESYIMIIVARTYHIVYQGSTPWHPTHEEGVYAYLIKVKFKDGSEKNFKGNVHVLK